MVERFDVFLLNLDETIGKDAKNTRPCVVVSPDEMNRNLGSVIIAPISSSQVEFPTRLPISVLNSERLIVLDQIRTVEKERLVKKIGAVEKTAQKVLLERLQEMFAA